MGWQGIPANVEMVHECDKQPEELQIFCQLDTPGWRMLDPANYYFTPIIFCPWCGKKLARRQGDPTNVGETHAEPEREPGQV